MPETISHLSAEMIRMFSLFGIGVVLVMLAGFYCLLASKNLIRLLIGLEVLTKSVTLLIIMAGQASGNNALGQSLAITLIIIEVAVIVVAVGVVLCIHRNNRSVDARLLRNIKG